MYLVTCLTTATATALMLAAVARNQTGMSLDAIRTVALSAAGLIFAAVSFGALRGRRKSRDRSIY